jgi:hypothetical protein
LILAVVLFVFVLSVSWFGLRILLLGVFCQTQVGFDTKSRYPNYPIKPTHHTNHPQARKNHREKT